MSTIAPRFVAVVFVSALLAAAPGAAVNRRAFVTSTTGTGNLATWAGASGSTAHERGDAICRARATAGSLPNPTTYRAWISDTTTDAFCHLHAQTGRRFVGDCVGTAQAAGPWYLANGFTPWTGDLDALATSLDPKVFRGVMLDELGDEFASLGESYIWTGTGDFGEKSNFNCVDWTSAASDQFAGFGSAFGSSDYWTFVGSTSCDNTFRLLCLEPGASEEPAHPNLPGALVFVTSVLGGGDLSLWPQAGGGDALAAGDAICRELARTAHLPAPESFVAWLSAGATAAASRLTTDGPFRRIDGLVVANSKTELVDGATNVSIHQNELGKYSPGNSFVWTGTGGDGEPFGVDCLGWTSDSNGQTGRAGAAPYQRVADWTSSGSQGCAAGRSLYCFANAITLFWDGFEYTGDTSRWSDDQK